MKSFLLARFYAKIKEAPNGCHEWQGATSMGYGQLMTNYPPSKLIYTHVFAFILEHKRFPLGDVHHKCNNKLCCNPAHLEEISRKNHMQIHNVCGKGVKRDRAGYYKHLRT